MPFFPPHAVFHAVAQGSVAQGAVVPSAGTQSTLPQGTAVASQDTLSIEALRIGAISADGSQSWEGDVVVRYGVSQIRADRVILYREAGRGTAEGRVTIVDPDGTARADRVEFTLDPQSNRFRSAKADNVEVRIGGALLRARHAELTPGLWTLLDAEGTTCFRRTPLYLVTTDKLIVRPGQQVVINQPRVSLFGKFIAEAPTQRFNLTPAVPGLHLPSPNYRPGQGFGLTWNGGIVAGPNGIFSFNARTFQGGKPSAFAQFTKSFEPISRATQIVAPQTDFQERFYWGYLDSVKVQSLGDEERFLRANRSSLSGGFQVNGNVVDRDRQTRYTKVEAVYEGSREVEGVGLLGQLRLQGLQREETGMEPRLVLRGSAGLPSVKLTPTLSTIARIDSESFAGSSFYGWGRGVVGLAYAPAKWLRLSGGVYGSFDVGRPAFEIDPLYAERGTLFRTDLAVGGLRLSYLTKSDARRGRYDNEISINQVIGCVEAFYILRDYPRDRRIGVTLRVQPLIDLFKRRGLSLGPNTQPNAAPSTTSMPAPIVKPSPPPAPDSGTTAPSDAPKTSGVG